MRPVLDRFDRIAALMADRIPHEEIHARLEPGILQLEVDKALASLMNRQPSGTPRQIPKKPWGLSVDRWMSYMRAGSAHADEGSPSSLLSLSAALPGSVPECYARAY